MKEQLKVVPHTILWIDHQPNHLSKIRTLLSNLQIHLILSHTLENALDYLIMKRWVAIFINWTSCDNLCGQDQKFFFNHPVVQTIPIIFLSKSINIKPWIYFDNQLLNIDILYYPIDLKLLKNKLKICLLLHQQALTIESSMESVKAYHLSLLKTVDIGIIGINDTGRIVFSNPKACKLIGKREQDILNDLLIKYIQYPPLTILLQDWSQYQFYHAQPTAFRHEFFLQQSYNKSLDIEFSVSPVIEKNKQFTGAVCCFQDITQRKEKEAFWFHQAHYDTLTGIANRILFETFFEQTLKRSQRLQLMAAVLFIDLDHFKQINDLFGHEQGDQLLVLSVNRLKHCIRSSDLIARIGGDEFAIVLNDIINIEHVAAVGKKILQQLVAPFLIANQWITINVSIGISVWPDHGHTVDSLLAASDIAMYQAKRASGSCLCFANKKHIMNTS
ncbi:MAG: sensor domain-containing diguanylate cyclase [Endozoicomonadaceae bacterium]|nr:sensor domain-containing diguanylate cyclase [Endozoicomonadaceae bacterium]